MRRWCLYVPTLLDMRAILITRYDYDKLSEANKDRVDFLGKFHILQ